MIFAMKSLLCQCCADRFYTVAGGVRRLLIPPSLAFVEGLEDGKPGPLPAGFGPRQQMRRVMSARKDVPGEYLYLEVQVTRVR